MGPVRLKPAAAPPRKDVLVLSSGGLFGAAQAGMLAELADTGWRPDAIVGVSAGALNGMWMACGFTSARAVELTGIWSSLHTRGVFPSRTVTQLLKVVTRAPAVQSGQQLRALIERCTPIADLADSSIECHIGATNLKTGSPEWFHRGPAIERLLASAAVPGLVPPVQIRDATYVDGAVASAVPVHRAVDLGATRIVCLDVSFEPPDAPTPTTALGVVLASFAATRARLAAAEIDRARQHTPAVWTIRPELPAAINSSHWHRTGELLDAGRAAMAAWLDQHADTLIAPAGDLARGSRFDALAARVRKYAQQTPRRSGRPAAATA